jgi:hypothetical protein
MATTPKQLDARAADDAQVDRTLFSVSPDALRRIPRMVGQAATA